MDYVVALKEMFESGVGSLTRSVNSMPEEKLDWRPAETSRTTRELLTELVTTTTYSEGLIKSMDPAKAEYAEVAWTDLKDWEAKYKKALEAYLADVAAFPEDKLHETVDLPWGKMTFLEVITYPYWNLMYHWGQINYLQTMYGDKEMP